jgi:hypothetical protein
MEQIILDGSTSTIVDPVLIHNPYRASQALLKEYVDAFQSLVETPPDESELIEIMPLAEEDLAPSNYHGGVEDENGTPLFIIISQWFNTGLYVINAISVAVFFDNEEWWKKLLVILLTVPEYVGFGMWMSEDNQENRDIYLILQYISFYSLLGVGIY